MLTFYEYRKSQRAGVGERKVRPRTERLSGDHGSKTVGEQQAKSINQPTAGTKKDSQN